MSEHLEMSEDSSLDRNFQIRTNNQGENELYIPCWEEEGSSSTQYHHLIEETKFFKNKCKHLENHLEENHREFSSLNQLYMIAESNERRLLKENEELKKRLKDLLAQLSQANDAHQQAHAELQAIAKRENDLRERLFRSKERETELANHLDLLQAQLHPPPPSPPSTPLPAHSQVMAQMEQRWKTAYEELEAEFDRKARELKDKGEEVKTLQKSLATAREEHEEKTKGLGGEVEELKRQVGRAKAVGSDHERNVRDLKAVLEEVSVKNDEIERENNKLRGKLKEESNRYGKLEKESRQQLEIAEEGKRLLEEQEAENSSLRSALSELKGKSERVEREAAELRLEKDRVLLSKNHLENANAALREQISQLHQAAQNHNHAIKLAEERIKQNKRASEELAAMSVNLADRDRQIATLQREIATLQRQIATLQRETTQESSASAKEEITQLKTEISDLKTENAEWRGKFEKLDSVRRELERQASTVADCGHQPELHSLREQLHSLECSKQELRQTSLRQERQLSELKSQLTQTSTRLHQQLHEKDSLLRQAQTLADEKQRLNSEISRLQEDTHALEDRKNTREKLKSAHEQELHSKTQLIEQLRAKAAQAESEVEILRSSVRAKEEVPEKDREKLKRLEARLQERDNLLQQQEARMEELETRTEEAESARKTAEKELRTKENELAKRDRKMKEMERELENSHLLEREVEELKQEIEAMRKQLRSEQSHHEKLKAQLAKGSDKENSRQGNGQDSSGERAKLEGEWEEKFRKMALMLKTKEEEIVVLRREQTNPGHQPAQNLTGQAQQSQRERIRELEEQVQRLQQSLRNSGDQDCSASLEQLEAEYQRQLLALKRLIVYKGYKEEEGKRSEDIRAEYEAKIQILLNDYKAMQQDLMVLREKLLLQRPEPTIDVAAIEQAWRIRIEELADEREVLIERVAMWERKYEELRYLFETKLEAKEEAINLLNLKLSNLEMSRTTPPPCPYPCHHR